MRRLEVRGNLWTPAARIEVETGLAGGNQVAKLRISDDVLQEDLEHPYLPVRIELNG